MRGPGKPATLVIMSCVGNAMAFCSTCGCWPAADARTNAGCCSALHVVAYNNRGEPALHTGLSVALPLLYLFEAPAAGSRKSTTQRLLGTTTSQRVLVGSGCAAATNPSALLVLLLEVCSVLSIGRTCSNQVLVCTGLLFSGCTIPDTVRRCLH